ncbi:MULTISPECIES: T9SS type A sorting domain-containing protein [unclassified Spirosoma]|uniref:T9SS type A sorting domain-containing protein n=1 Tax=unclassified Spirosoma TaxID=2621999 RepID=UPI000960172F|nr:MULTISPECIES: T9SS type A sorting domain-containing protein [unclassified Spirosoma]MBN8825647.1 T9SS type A sorting domain-containing protein [Spirosoma sp.]OJW71653.1 MAG: hypothetical protein BGO59_27175 [Spirosoma sp. 48-14]
MKFLLVIISWFSLLTVCRAQTISLTNPASRICTSTPISISFTTTGNFLTGNYFTAQLRSEYNQLIDLRLEESNGKFALRIPESLIASDDRRYNLRITSSLPYIASDWSTTFQISKPASITLASILPSQANPYQPLTMRLITTGTGTLYVTMSDSSRLELPTGYYQPLEQTRTIFATKSTTYSVASIRNECGIGPTTGKAVVTVNDIAIRTVAASPSTVCQGSYLYVSYSIQQGSLNPDNRFRVRLTNYNPSQAIPYPEFQVRQYELPAEVVEGRLKVLIPTSVDAAPYGGYFVQVISSSPQAVSDAMNVSVQVASQSRAEMSSLSTIIDCGQPYSIAVKASGPGPYSFSLSNGSSLYSINEWASQTVIPLATTNYQITDFQSSCDQSTIVPSSTLVTVRPGIRVDSIPDRIPLCEGTTAKLGVSMNLVPTAETEFWVDILQQGGNLVVASAPAKMESNKLLSFQVPVVPHSTEFGAYNAFSVRVRTVNPSTTGGILMNQYLTINAKPSIFIPSYSSQTIDKPGNVSPYIQQPGGAPYELKLSTGRIYRNDCIGCTGLYTTLYARQTTTFSVDYVKNACGTLQNPAGNFTISVKNSLPVAVEIDSVQQGICSSDSILVYFHTFGDFATDNEFRVNSGDPVLCEGCGSFEPVVGRGLRSPIKVKLSGDSKVRIAATKPVVNSNEFYVHVSIKPYAELSVPYIDQNYSNGAELSAITAGQPVTIVTAWTGFDYGPYSLTITDGQRDYPVPGNQLVITPPQDKTTTYRIKQVANKCGIGQANPRPVVVTPMPFRILIPKGGAYGQLYQVCGGSSISIPFSTYPITSTTTTFVLQVANKRDSIFTDWATGTRSPIVATVPTNLPEGSYYLRIIDRSSTARTAVLPLVLMQSPSATLKLVSPITGEVNPGNSVIASLSFTGTSPWQVQFSDNQQATFYQSPSSYEFTPATGSNFSIRTLSNSCGYGTTSGSFTTRVKPQLQTTSVIPTVVCAGASTNVTVKTMGDFSANDRMTFSLISSAGASLDLATASTASGTFPIAVPATVRPGTYELRLTSTDPTVTPIKMQVSVISTPNYTLLGNTTINAGQITYLTLQSLDLVTFGDQITYRLSDGTTGTLNTYGISKLAVSPAQTIQYLVSSISNGCGTGKSQGMVTVTVNPISSRSINTDLLQTDRLCSGTVISVPYTAKGTFSANNIMTVYLSDSTGLNFKPISTSGTTSPLKATIPLTTPVGKGYRIRILASDQDVSSGASPEVYQILQGATAAFDSATYYFRPNEPVNLKIRFTGEPPWYYQLQDNTYIYNNYTAQSPTVFTVRPLTPGVYRLISVANSCGVGKVMDPSVAHIELITATESLQASIRVGPNPAQETLQVEIIGITGSLSMQLMDMNGALIQRKTSKQTVTQFDLTQLPAGSYLLVIKSDRMAQQTTYRIVKQ